MRAALIVIVLGGCVAGNPPALDDPSRDATTEIEGGMLPELRFAIVGDTRPANEDDTANYPTAIIQQIWEDVEREQPQPPFGVTTGDYMNASPDHTEQNPQLDLYLGARAHYARTVYPTMGNHECTGSTVSMCGLGNPDGVTRNYRAFMSRMVEPLGVDRPWYTVHFAAADGSWTAKLVFIAANVWTPEQATYLEQAMTPATTYTFVIRHEPHYATAVRGVVESDAILARHPFTLLITGHVHTYARYPEAREVLVGNGGAPLISAIDYGYAIVFRRPDGTIDLTAYDYLSRAVIDHFAIHADGSPAQ